MKIKFYKHAKLKFADLKEQGFRLDEKQVLDSVKNPDKSGKDCITDRWMAEKIISNEYKLRVFFEKHKNYWEIVTFYPTRRKRYENEI